MQHLVAEGGCLCGSVRYRITGAPRSSSVWIEQGHEIGRPSLVMLRARMVDGRREVSVGGSVFPTVRGELA